MSTDYRALINKARDPESDLEPEDLIDQLADALDELLIQREGAMTDHTDPGFVPSPDLIDSFQRGEAPEPRPDGIVPPYIRDRIAEHKTGGDSS
jgi:hypothetical protein